MYIPRILAAKKKPWNKGKLIGPKQPLSLKQIWSIRHSLRIEERWRDLALFNLAIDSKLRACDLLRLRVSDISSDGQVNRRATILQQKTRSPVRFEITSASRRSIETWIDGARLSDTGFLFPSRQHSSQHLSLRQYSRILGKWVRESRFGPDNVRNPFYEEDESDVDLPTNQEHSGLCSSSWVTPNWRVLSGISVLILMTRWKFQSKLTCNFEWRVSGIPRKEPLRC